jgi:hypothetical protein
MTTDTGLLSALGTAYPSGIGGLDPFVGILAEPHVPGSSLGETGRRLFKLQAEKTRDSDRFWYQNQMMFDARLLKGLESLGFAFSHDVNGFLMLDRKWASVLVDNTAIGESGFPLSRQTAAFFTVHP